MQFDTMRIANSILGLTLLVLLAMALIAGQVRGAQELDSIVTLDRGNIPASGLVLTRDNLKTLDSLPQLVENIRSLPVSIEIRHDGVRVRPESPGAPYRKQ